MPRDKLIQLRRGLSSVWSSVNPILGDGELGYEQDSGDAKIGNGVDDWASLPYVDWGGGSGSLTNAIVTVVSDSGSFTATGADTLNIVGNGNTNTSITGDVLTISVNVTSFSVTRVTSSQSITTSFYQWNANTDSGDITLTLPAGVNGSSFKVVNTGISTNQLFVVPNGSDKLIGENNTYTLNDGEALILTYETTDGWY